MLNKFNSLTGLLLLATASSCSAQTTAPQTAATSPQVAPQTIEAGDRHPLLNCIYPPEAMFHNGKGGTVLDITQAPFNAKGDGITDDTAAFVAAYDFVLREQDKVGYNAPGMIYPDYILPNKEGYSSDGPLKSSDSSFLIYVPNGNYLVSDTIIYSMPDRTPSKKIDIFYRGKELKEARTGWERLTWIRFVGQSRDKTIVRLQDNAPGFGAGNQKAVFAYGKSKFNNRKGFNVLRNLTVDTGKGNVGAVAVDFTGANKAQINNITLRSGDGNGHCGLIMKRPPIIGYHSDISVEGFDYGIISRVGHETAPVFEWVTLKSQNKAGILLSEDDKDGGTGQATLTLRKLKFEGRAPAAQLKVEGGHLILLDSELIGAGAAQPAFDVGRGQLYLNNIAVEGFSSTVQDGNETIAAGRIGQYVSGQPILLSADNAQFARLAVQEVPVTEWPSGPEEWATPAQFGAKGDDVTDDTAAIQKAFDAGKPWVFLTQARYKTSQPIRVPASVRAVDGMLRYNSKLEFEVSEASEAPLRFSQLFRSDVKHNAKRPIVFELSDSNYSNTKAAVGSTLFLLNGSYPSPKSNPAQIDVFAWSMNNEGGSLPIRGDGAKTWILGVKTEHGPVASIKNGGRMEIYGATIGTAPKENAFVVEDSSLVVVANSSNGSWGKDMIAIREVQDGKAREIKAGELAERQKGEGLRIIPLFVSGMKKPTK